MEASVKHHIENGIGTLSFGNTAGNSLPKKVMGELVKTLNILGESKEVRVIVIQSAGDKAFCGGASLTEMNQLDTLTSAKAFFMGIADVLNTLRSLEKFVVLRVQGKVVGGGLGLVAACDYVIAHQSASVKLSELSIGIGPYVIEPALSRKMGSAAFAQLSLEAHQWKSADWAHQKGLYHQIVDNIPTLDQKVEEMANRLASYTPQACKTLRKLHWKDTDHWDELLEKNAEITGTLALQKETQDFLKTLFLK